ncbi:MAG: hypothetical protein MUC92_08885 [Fimbriimonadaceae bacterium]|jgi:hypothetical protein|nr:hypothetical protein [Fimbriimonadaceae bacterium]
MNTLTLVPLVALGFLGQAQPSPTRGGTEIRLNVVNQNLMGTARLTNVLQDNGQKLVQMTMDLTDVSGRKVTVVQESTYERSGRPLRKSQTTMLDGGKAKQSVFVEFQREVVKITAEAGGKTLETEQEIPREIRSRINATPEFWFIRDTVAPGGETTYFRFDLSKQTWEKTHCVYHGRRQVSLAGRRFNAHLVVMGPFRILMDDSGNPLRLTSEGLTMERIF